MATKKIKEQTINKNLTVIGDLTVIGEINRGELTYLKNTGMAHAHSIGGGAVSYTHLTLPTKRIV